MPKEWFFYEHLDNTILNVSNNYILKVLFQQYPGIVLPTNICSKCNFTVFFRLYSLEKLQNCKWRSQA